MSAKKIKPVTPLARADAALTVEHRKQHPKYDDDVARYGQRVADYNTGWLACDTHNRKKNRRKS